MASTYKYPEDFISWFIKGNHLAIVTLKGETSGSTHAKYGQYKPIDEAVTHGVLIHYQAEPNSVSQLYQDKAGTTGDANVAGVSMNLAGMHEGKWNEAVKRHGMQKRDKTGGDRRIFMTDFT